MRSEQTQSPVAVITGAAKRLGRATAKLLHQQGVNVVLQYRSSKQQALELENNLNQTRPDSALALPCILEDTANLQTFAKQALGFKHRVDFLINNASVFNPCRLDELSDKHWQTVMDVNVKAPVFLAKCFLPTLRERNGCIINMIDIYAERPLDNHPVYCASKAALAMATKSLAKDLAPEVRVNGVSPGAILWPEVSENGSQTIDDQYQKALLEKVPMNRLGDESDIAKTIAWLALEAPYVTGQVIAVDGGRTLNM